MPLIFKILAVTGSAMFAGVMLAIGVILGSYWKGLPPAIFLDWFAANNHLVARAIPLVLLPALVGIAGMLVIEWSNPAVRNIWLASAACLLIVLLLTATLFVPANSAFAAKTVPLDQVRHKLDVWLGLHTVRIAFACISAVLGVWAVSR
ncbi:DUF1772 domain-containing protein [Novosphingobium sp. RL4]|uniref:DUF1772 domain-containing protein n=1 Tax=Novosphingobium sp. RL4 TaxID=3109595 RepID=UPI002D77BE55|nr:DUF1772 domain-containing protein [Novosphingobium sp. RL4]WRT94451.1 DUF1772 domain-containing protein [Novosphingobium sp. RL4]